MDFRFGDLDVVQERKAVRGEAADMPFAARCGFLAFDDGMFSRNEALGEVEIAPFLSPYGEGLLLVRLDDAEHGIYSRRDFTPRSKRSQALASDSSLAA